MIVFDLLYPSPPLRSNKRLHHMAEHRIKRDIRQVGFIQASRHVRLNPESYPLPGVVEIRMVWTVPTRHRRDADSGQPTLKSWVDGAVSAGLLTDDSFRYVRRMFCEIDPQPGKPMSLRIEISEVPT